MKIGPIIIIAGFIAIIIGIFPLYGASPDVFLILAGILCIITGVFRNKGHFNKNYFIAVFSVTVLWGLILLYICLFKTNEYLDYNLYAGLFIVLVIYFGREYIIKLKKGNL